MMYIKDFLSDRAQRDLIRDIPKYLEIYKVCPNKTRIKLLEDTHYQEEFYFNCMLELLLSFLIEPKEGSIMRSNIVAKVSLGFTTSIDNEDSDTYLPGPLCRYFRFHSFKRHPRLAEIDRYLRYFVKYTDFHYRFPMLIIGACLHKEHLNLNNLTLEFIRTTEYKLSKYTNEPMNLIQIQRDSLKMYPWISRILSMKMANLNLFANNQTKEKSQEALELYLRLFSTLCLIGILFIIKGRPHNTLPELQNIRTTVSKLLEDVTSYLVLNPTGEERQGELP